MIDFNIADSFNLSRTDILNLLELNTFINFSIDGPVLPSQAVSFTWRVRTYRANKNIGNVRIKVFLEGFPSRPIFDQPAGVRILATSAASTDTGSISGSIPIPGDIEIARRLYTTGDKQLYFELSGDGPDGTAVRLEDTLTVVSENIDNTWWNWTGPNISGSDNKNWKQAYTLRGELRNASLYSAMNTSIYLLETEIFSSTETRERVDQRIDPLGVSQINFQPITQQWQWYIPAIWLITDAFPKLYTYQASIHISDTVGNDYIPVISTPFNITVSISGVKIAAAITAYALTSIAAGLLISAGLAVLGIVTAFAAPGLAAAAAGAYAGASAAGAIAADPPEPDQNFTELVGPIVPELPKTLLKDEKLKPFTDFLSNVYSILAGDEALTKTEAKIMGAETEKDVEWMQNQSKNYREILDNMKGIEEQLYKNLKSLNLIFDKEQIFDLASQDEIRQQIRSGIIPESISQAWNAASLDQKALQDILFAAQQLFELSKPIFITDYISNASSTLNIFVTETDRRAYKSNI